MLTLLRMQVQSVVLKVRSHKLHGRAGRKKFPSSTSLLLVTKLIYLIKSILILITPDNPQKSSLKVPFSHKPFTMFCIHMICLLFFPIQKQLLNKIFTKWWGGGGGNEQEFTSSHGGASKTRGTIISGRSVDATGRSMGLDGAGF